MKFARAAFAFSLRASPGFHIVKQSLGIALQCLARIGGIRLPIAPELPTATPAPLWFGVASPLPADDNGIGMMSARVVRFRGPGGQGFKHRFDAWNAESEHFEAYA